jgi:hypothetical protein
VSGLALIVAWSLASPVGASPDEPAHISYAWATVTGQTLFGERLVSIPNRQAVNGQMVTLPGSLTVNSVRVPQKLLQYPSPSCYAFKPEQPVVQCSPIPSDTMANVTVTSNMSRYPPLFYGFEGSVMRAATSVGLSGPRVLYSARLAAGILSWLAAAFGIFLLSRRFPARVVLLATLLGLPATAWFLAGSINPSGLEISAAFLLAAAVLSVRIDCAVGVRSRAAVLAVPLGTLLLAWTRPLSWVWASLILGLLLLPTPRRTDEPRTQRLPLRQLGTTATVATILLLVTSVAWFDYAIQIRSTTQAGSNDWDGLDVPERIILLLFHTGTLVSDQVGNFGWLDTPLPSLAVFVWLAIAGMTAAAWGMGRNSLVPRWSVGVVLGVGYLAALLDEYRGAWGWQGRYLLPVTAAVCVFAIPGIAQGLERWRASERAVSWVLMALMALNALSVIWFLFRNAYGVRDWPARLPSVPFPLAKPVWSPPTGISGVLALVMLALACGVLAVWSFRPDLSELGTAVLTPEVAPEALPPPRTIALR